MPRGSLEVGWDAFDMLLCPHYCSSCYLLTFVYLLIPLSTTLIFSYPQHSSISPHLVSTKYGFVRGLRIQFASEAPSGKHLDPISAYFGLPYASPPINAYRFMPPVAPLPWSPGTRMATNYAPSCPQQFPDISNRTRALEKMTLLRFEFLSRLIPFLANQSEDCLYLNLFVPGGSRGDTKHPILFVIHGESWEWGSGNEFDGSVLASIGHTIVVTFNYRLGILGFLKTSNQQSNFGLLDVIAALHWVRENGNVFGGDPERITILGYRTGAVIANLLLVAPIAKDLFSRCILVGGTLSSPWALQSRPEDISSQAARYLSCPTILPLSHPESDIAPCLRQKHLTDLLAFTPLSPRFLSPFAPWIDNVLITHPMEIKQAQLLLIFTTSEGVNELSEVELNGFEFEHRDRLLRTMVRNVYNYHQQEIFSIVKNEYTDWERPMMHPIPLRDSVVEALSDCFVIGPIVKFGLGGKGGTTWMIHFSHVSGRDGSNERLGSLEGEVVPYLMGLPILNGVGSPWSSNFTKQDSSVADILIHYLSNFVRSGDPNTNDLLSHDASNERLRTRLHWEPFNQLTQLYMNLGAKPRVKSHYRGHRLALWINLIPQIHAPGGADLIHHTFQDSNPALYSGPVRSIHPINTFIGADSTITPTSTASTIATLVTECLDSTPFPHTNPLEVDTLDSSSPSRTRDMDSDYSTALTVTLTVGVCLILLNVVVFSAIMCGHRNKGIPENNGVHNGQKEYQQDDVSWESPPQNYATGPSVGESSSILEYSGPPPLMSLGRQNYSGESIRLYMNQGEEIGGDFHPPPPQSFQNTLQRSLPRPSPPSSSNASTPNTGTGLVGVLKRSNHIMSIGGSGGGGVKKRVQIQEISV